MQPAPDFKPESADARPLDALTVGAGKFAGELWANQVGLWRLDVERDHFQWLNDWCERLGIDPCNGTNHATRWNYQIHPDDLPNTGGYELLVANNAQMYEAEYRLRTLAGDWRWVLSQGRIAEVNARGGPSIIIGLTMDIDDRCRWLNDWCRTHDFDECSSPDHHARWKANTHPDDRAARNFEAEIETLLDEPLGQRN